MSTVSTLFGVLTPAGSFSRKFHTGTVVAGATTYSPDIHVGRHEFIDMCMLVISKARQSGSLYDGRRAT
uniref:Putative secreted protein n=1 Tax=Ixodes ricinus TaxID=34613 RepID=A0A6B0TR49_IXORI